MIQTTFRALNVGFIAVTYNFESLTADYYEFSLVLPVKNFVNDAYCRDISGKVRSCQKIKREKGEFIGAFAVYGYQKDPEKKNHLVPDEYAAEVVRNIFDRRIAGMSATAIAKRLNDMGVPSPMEHKRAKGVHYATSFASGVQAKWSAVAVKRILTNRVYVGTLEQGKTEKVSVKVNKYCPKPREEWARVEHAHEAIVSLEDFERVQRLLSLDSRAGKGGDCAHMFSGLLFCGDCGEPMVRRSSRYKGKNKISFICSTRNKGKGCTRHSILEEELKEAVLAGLRAQAALLADREGILSRVGELKVGFDKTGLLQQEIARLAGVQEKYLALKSSLYEDWRDGVITQEDFYAFGQIFGEKYDQAGKAIAAQKELMRSCLKSGAASDIELERFRENMQLTELNRDVLMTFVRRIDIYEDKRISVEWNIKGGLWYGQKNVFGGDICPPVGGGRRQKK